MGFFVDWSAEP